MKEKIDDVMSQRMAEIAEDKILLNDKLSKELAHVIGMILQTLEKSGWKNVIATRGVEQAEIAFSNGNYILYLETSEKGVISLKIREIVKE